MKELYPYIFKRKSNRKYDMAPIDAEIMAQIKLYAKNLKPLYENIKVTYRITDNVKNVIPVKAPYYFIITSETTEGYLTNIGYMYQQMDLFLSSKGLGGCWLGMARPIDKDPEDLEFSMVFAFGKTTENPYRELDDFKRKELSEISSGDDDRLETVRLAPSATNSQNWFFIADNGKIHTYQRNVSFVKARIYGDMNRIDMGIAICHLNIATEFAGNSFSFGDDEDAPEREGYTYVGTVM